MCGPRSYGVDGEKLTSAPAWRPPRRGSWAGRTRLSPGRRRRPRPGSMGRRASTLSPCQRPPLDVALAEDGVLLAAVGAAEVAVVLHQAQNGDVHHLGHLDGLGDNHAHQILGGGDDDDAVHREGLEHRQGHVAGSGGHIPKEIAHLAPDDVGPELLDRAGDDRAAPDDRVGLVLGEEVETHDLNAGLGLRRVDTPAHCPGRGCGCRRRRGWRGR